MARKRKKNKIPKNLGGNATAQSNDSLYVIETNAISHAGSTYDRFNPSFQWTTKSDEVYGIISTDPLNPPNQSPTRLFGKVTPTLPATMDTPFSMQWEYEFSPTRIVKTSGGNDSDAARGDGMFREVITGNFLYRNGTISGTIDSCTFADYEQGLLYRSSSSQGVVDQFTYEQESITHYSATIPIPFTGFRGLGKAIASERGINLRVAAEYKSTQPALPGAPPSDRTIVDANGLSQILPQNWWNTPFTPNLV